MNGIAIAILLLTFVFLLVIKCPITFSMVISTSLAMLYLDIPVMTMVQQMCKQLNSFTLLAIPFFILMGELMAQGGISSRLLKFADVCVGRFTGGLAHVNVLASMLFGGISGSAIADVSSLGVIEIPMMTDAGYDVDFSTAVTVTSACQGLIIPPSHNMVLYAMVAGGVSVGKLFCAGYVPGILLGVSLMVCCYFISKKKNYGKGKKLPLKEALAVTKDTVLAMLAMVIVIGGVSVLRVHRPVRVPSDDAQGYSGHSGSNGQNPCDDLRPDRGGGRLWLDDDVPERAADCDQLPAQREHE